LEGKKVFQPAEPCTDRDGNVYRTVKVGDQIWMAENLRVKSAAINGVPPPRFSDGAEKGSGVKFYDGQPRYAFYQNKEELGHGALYNFAALEHCDLCPAGYRLPDREDWARLLEAVGGSVDTGAKLPAVLNVTQFHRAPHRLHATIS
jgi:uncharacterized protein (TIGR02145 family)